LNKVKDEVRNRRVLQRMSQKELAEKSGVDRSYISQIENGKFNPSLTTLERIAHALGCSLKDFF
jgi:transcriptional regulator with XRE-family HTH domain